MRSPRLFCRYVLIVLLLAAPLAPAQEPAQPMPRPAASELDVKPAREQTIYIPYTKLRQIFEKEGRGVFVPYDEFQRLWKAAQAAAKKIEEYKPPVSTLIAEIDSRATVSRDVMTVEAKLQIDVLAEGWHHVYLRLKDAAIHSATIASSPARLIFEADKGYWVLIEKKGKEPERIELTLTYSKAFTKQPGTNSVEFDAPQAPVNRWQIRIAEPGVKVNVHPNISATDGGAEDMGGKDDKPEQPLELHHERGERCTGPGRAGRPERRGDEANAHGVDGCAGGLLAGRLVWFSHEVGERPTGIRGDGSQLVARTPRPQDHDGRGGQRPPDSPPGQARRDVRRVRGDHHREDERQQGGVPG